jgi:predicted nucleic acid-binding protein
MIVVSDSSPLIALCDLGKLDLLRLLYGQVVLPDAVWRETAIMGQDKPERKELLEASWIECVKVRNQVLAKSLAQKLDVGESEAIVLALELNADLLLMDERLGRNVASRFGIDVTGVVGILLVSKSQGYLPAIKPELDRLRNELDFWLSESLYRRALSLAEEL